MAFNKNKAIAAAQKHAQRGNLARAIKGYLEVVDYDPDDTRVWLRIAELYAKSGAVSNAIQTYKRVADYYGDKGFFQKGVAVYKNVLKMDPANLDAHMSLGEFYVQLGRAPDAIRQFQTVVGTYERDGRHSEGLALLKRILELAPDNNANRIRLAEALARAGRTEEAIETFRVVLSSLYDRGAHDDYIQVAERLLYLEAEQFDVVRQLSEVYLLKNDAKRALARLQVAFKSDPTNPSTLSLLARAFAKIGQKSKAVSVYRELARIHEESGDDAARIGAFQAILALDPKDPDAIAATGGAMGELSATPSLRSTPGSSIEEALSNEELAKRYLVDAELYRKYSLDDHAYERLKAIFEFEPGNPDAGAALRELAQEMDRGEEAAAVLLQAADTVADNDRERAMALLGDVLQLQPGHGGASERMRALSAGMQAALPVAGEPALFDDDDDFNVDLDLDELGFDDGLSDSGGGLAFEIDPTAPAPDDDAFGDLLGDSSAGDFADLGEGAEPPPDDDEFSDLLADSISVATDDEFGDLLDDGPAGDDFDGLLVEGDEDDAEPAGDDAPFDDFDDLLGGDAAASAEFGGLLDEGQVIAPPPPEDDEFGDLLANDDAPVIAPPPPDDRDDFGDLLANDAPPPPLDEFDEFDDSEDGDEATIALQTDDLNLAHLIQQSSETSEASQPPPPRSAPPIQLAPEPETDAQLDDFFAELGADQLENHEDLFESVDRGTLDASDIGERLNDDNVAPPASADDFGDLIGRRTPAPVSKPAQPMQFVGDSQDAARDEPEATEDPEAPEDQDDAEAQEAQETQEASTVDLDEAPNPVSKPKGRVAPGSLPPLPRRPSTIRPPPPLAPRKRSAVPPPPPPPPKPEVDEHALESTPPPAPAPPEVDSAPPPPVPPATSPAIADFGDGDEATEARDLDISQLSPAVDDGIELLDDDLIELDDDDFDIEDYEEPDSLSGSIAGSMASMSQPPPQPPPEPAELERVEIADTPDEEPTGVTQQVDVVDAFGAFDDDDDEDATIMGEMGGFGLPPPPSLMTPSEVGEDDPIDETVALSTADLGGPAAEVLAELDFLLESALIEDARELIQELERKFPNSPTLAARRARLSGGAAGSEHDELLDSIEANEADFATVAGAQLSDLSHDDAATHFDLGVAFKEMGQYAKAIEQLEVAARSLERRTEALQLIALCHLESGHAERCAETLQAALANAELAAKQRHELQYDLATAYEQMGDNLRASQQLHAIVADVGDGFRDIKARLERLG